MPHSYWRIRFTTSTGGAGSDIWLDEVVFRLGTQVCDTAGGVASASSMYSTQYAPAKAFDKTADTDGWASATGAFPAWVGYEFAAPVDVDNVLLTASEWSGGLDELPVPGSAFLEWSDDGVAWTTVTATMAAFPAAGAVVVLRDTSMPIPAGALGGIPGFLNPHGMPTTSHQRLALVPTTNLVAGGSGRVAGTTKIKPDSPVARRVQLIDEKTKALVAETWSNLSGEYVFNGVALGRPFTVLSYDHTLIFRAVVSDRVFAEPMP